MRPGLELLLRKRDRDTTGQSNTANDRQLTNPAGTFRRKVCNIITGVCFVLEVADSLLDGSHVVVGDGE